MTEDAFPWDRYAVMAELAGKAPKGQLGRTALMKYTYFLQVLRGVPLGFNFTLYSYGPFDAAVLDDLAYAETLGAVRVNTVNYSNGYGYAIRPGPAAREVKSRAREFLITHQGSIDWVISQFGSLTAAELELVSTIVFVDREALRSGEQLPLADLTRRVREIKPHFSNEQADAQARSLLERGLLQATRS